MDICKSMIRLSLILLIFIYFGSTPSKSYAQKTGGAGFIVRKVPKSESKDVVSLAQYLTKDVSGDSMKVVAISSWIVTNIKYDYKALKSGNWQKRSTKKILKTHKALCGGFAELFNEMCFESGIASEEVIGYTKSWNYEPYDSLIRAEHAWNVVKVDGSWRPIDLSWSTGYTERKKQKFRKRLYLWFNIPYKIKYKFINELTYKYMFTSPDVFVKSHLPLQPYWQLLTTPVPIIAFEKNSVTEYLNNDNNFTLNYNYAITRHQVLPKPDKYLKGALQAFDYNKKNHRVLGFGYFNYTTELQNEIDPKLPEELQIEKLDSCLTLYKVSKNMYGEYLKDTQRELKRRNKRNDGFKKYLLEENGGYIKQHNENYKAHKKAHYKSRTEINKKKGLIRKYERRIGKVRGSLINNVKRPTKENGVKIAKAKEYIMALDDLESLIEENKKISMDTIYSSIDGQIEQKDSLHPILNQGYQVILEISKFIKPYRFYYNEYSKPWIDSIKNTIGENYIINFDLNKRLIGAYDSLFILNDSLINFYDLTFTDSYLLQLKNLKGLKKSSMQDMDEDADYLKYSTEIVANYQRMIFIYDSIIKINQKRLPELKSYADWNKKIIKQLRREIKLEYKRFHLLNRQYRRWFTFYKNQALYLKRVVEKREVAVKQEINYLNKQIKIRESKLKKGLRIRK